MWRWLSRFRRPTPRPFDWGLVEHMKLTLLRSKQDDVCTFGALFAADGTLICYTLEEPWRDNAKGVSCIPAGSYPWFIRVSKKNGGTGHRAVDVPELKDVPNRTNVQIHIGNTLADTEGCILVGSARGVGAGISGSKLAFEKLMKEIGDVKEGTLDVVDVPPPKAA